MLFVGITGGVGAGKSELLKYLSAHYNCRVLLTDEIAHDLMEPGTDCYEKLRELFKDEAADLYEADGSFCRPNLAKIIFADEAKREALNGIVHPAVKQYVIAQHAKEKEAGVLDLFVVESALLIDDNYQLICDEMWYIYTTEANRKSRLKASRGYSDEKIRSIFESQLSEQVFRSHCQEVIDNNHTTEHSFARIREILDRKGICERIPGQKRSDEDNDEIM